MRKYLEVLRITVRSHTVYVYDIAFNSLFMAVVMFAFLQLWRATYGGTGQRMLGGFAFSDMVWYLVMTETIVMSMPALASRIDQEIKTGDIAYSLARPYSYLGFHYAAFLGEAAVRMPVNYLVGASVAWLGTRTFPVPGWHLLGQALAIWLGVTLFFLNRLVMGLIAFWTEETSGFQLIYDRAMWILGGLLLPVELFPGPLRGVAEVLPFRYAINGPARLFVRFDVRYFLELLEYQGVWLAVLGLAAHLLYRAGMRRVTLNGG